MINKINETLSYFKVEFPGNEKVWNQPISPWAMGVSANDLKSIMGLLQESATLLQRYCDWYLHDEKSRPKDKEAEDLIRRIYAQVGSK